MNDVHKTAMTRKSPSAPMKWLASNDMIVGRALDWGCGRGYDAETYNMESYDPHFQPIMPDGKFKTITCGYVLNTIEFKETRLLVLRDMQSKLELGGKIYISVRNDKRALHGTTSKKTWQGLIVLKLPVVRKMSGYTMYLLTNENINYAIEEVYV